MSLWEAVALGLLQGLTEFFPVSSSGHLVLAEAILGVNPPGLSFEVLVHVATLAAVLVLYRRRIVTLVVGALNRDGPSLRYLGMLAVASIPALIVGITAARPISGLFDRPLLAAGNLLFTGALVYATRWLIGRGERTDPGWGGALLVGVAQSVAILPGISRSGATVAAALWFRMERGASAEFSFLLSVPAIIAAAALQVPGIASAGDGMSLSAISAATVAAFAAGVAAILLFVRWLRGGRFHRFAYYCWAVGGAFIVYGLMS